jgi:chemotaxis protein MotA
MFQIIGIAVLFIAVFGSFLMSHGKMAVIIEAAPHELMAILGAGVAAFLIGNSMTVIKATAGGFGKVFAGPKWKTSDYRDLLSLLYLLTKTMKSKGVIALESHIERPAESTIFSNYPRLTKDHFAIDFICDTLRMMTMNLEDPHQVEDAMEKQLEKHHHEALAPAGALQNMADALPALGIVAAVLGVIKTMGSITEPPESLGQMSGGALVGPMATRLKSIVEEEGSFYRIIQSVLVAHLHGNAAQISVEIGRGDVPSPAQPSFLELEEALQALPAQA